MNNKKIARELVKLAKELQGSMDVYKIWDSQQELMDAIDGMGIGESMLLDIKGNSKNEAKLKKMVAMLEKMTKDIQKASKEFKENIR